MNCKDVQFYTNTIPIINDKGERIDEIKLSEKIRPVPRRRCGISDNEIYYKGAGIIYTGHFVNEYGRKLKLVSETGIVYEKYNVVNPIVFRKYGIFTFKHQPCFSDFEGGCGAKERRILDMQKNFQLSAIEEIIDVIDTPLPKHSIYKYKLKEVNGNYLDTINLIEYILTENYNTGWDKNVWDDIECFGYVRDLADWFVSDEFCHKLGTIYSLLNNLIKKDKYTYERIVRALTQLEQLGDYHIIYISALIVKKYSPDCINDLDLDELNDSLYYNLWNELYRGKACCHLENESEWGYVKELFTKNIVKNVELAKKDMIYHRLSKNNIRGI